MSKKSGYTLAEVLISVLIVGIVAAVCAPMIRDTIPNKNATMIKKAYYIVDNIVKDLLSDTYYYPDMRGNCVEFVGTGTSSTPYYSTSTEIPNCFVGLDYNQQVKISDTNILTDSSTGNGNKKFAKLFASKLQTQDSFDTVNSKLSGTHNSKIIGTTDGIVYNFTNMDYRKTRTYYELKIDVNGISGPNSYAESFKSDAGAKNKCEDYDSWNPTDNGDKYENKKFDRIVIWIYYDGHIEIPYRQTEFENIINGQNINGQSI